MPVGHFVGHLVLETGCFEWTKSHWVVFFIEHYWLNSYIAVSQTEGWEEYHRFLDTIAAR